MGNQTVPLTVYLFTRLRQLVMDSIFGLPKDYNSNILGHIEPTNLRWFGNCSKLNTGCAADGYARIKGTA